MLRRLILSNAYPVEVDKVGRILVPQNLREFLGIASGELVWRGRAITLKCGLLQPGANQDGSISGCGSQQRALLHA
jgi:hypothetical protein